MQLPREIIVGKESLKTIGSICRNLGLIRSALVITGSITRKIAGNKVVDLLYDEGIKVNSHVVCSKVPTLMDVECAQKCIKKWKPQVVLGVGGGAKIDIAKLSSARLGIPIMSVPTTASHDGMASPFASVNGLNRPHSIKAQSPIAVIADTDIIVKAPYRFIASGCADAISKMTSTRDWKLAHEKKNEYYAQYTASLALMSAKHIITNAHCIKPGSEEGARVILEALLSCGVAMCIGGTSRPCSGSEHLFSHALNLTTPKCALHGEQCGLGTIMMAYLHGIEWELIRETLHSFGAPITAVEAGINPKHIVNALVRAVEIRPDRYTILNERKLNKKSAYELAKATGVI